MNDYYKVRIELTPCSEDLTDLTAAFLADEGFESFEPDEKGLNAYISSGVGNGLDIAQKALENFPGDVKFALSQEFIEGKDWNEEWERNYFQPILIDNRCVIHSSFHSEVPDADYDIVIDPKMAFGTGHHDTTSRMVCLILDNNMKGKSVIDMGTGTGILGILASMRGAASVTGIEIDEAAYLNAIENVELNGADMRLIHGDASQLAAIQPADYLFANINRNIILNDFEKYADRVKANGNMFLSGFYEEDIPMILDEARKYGFVLNKKLVSNRWSALHLCRTNTTSCKNL